MKNPLPSALRALEARRASTHEWSRLERAITSDAAAARRLAPESLLGARPVEDTSEMRRYLAAQTAQTV